MNTLATYLLLSLVAAHILADLLFQTRWIVVKKKRTGILLLHAAEHALLSYLLVGLWSNWQFPLIIFTSHALIDGLKIRFPGKELHLFVVDQLAHLAVILFLVWSYAVYLPVAEVPYWAQIFGVSYYRVLVLVSGAVFTIKGGAILVSLLVKPYMQRLKQYQVLKGGSSSLPVNPLGSGFKDGGWVIGMLERSLILLFVLVGQPAAIGFLIAAKSIFRFSEVSDRSQRMQAEYILIGTLYSFLFGLLCAYIMLFTLERLALI